MTKKLIVNADDFGLDGGINEGIILAHQKGILTSATIMANMPGFSQAVELAGRNERLGVGIHLNALRGQPLSSPSRVPSLLNADGCFWSDVFVFLRKLISGRIRPEQVEAEWRAHVEKVLETGIKPTHLDSEKHLHAVPSLFKIACRLAKDFRVPRVRFIHEYCLSPSPAQSLKSWGISLSCTFMKKKIQESGIITTDHFSGICRSGRMTVRAWKKVLARLKDGVTEVMVHPGFRTEEVEESQKQRGSYYIHKNRERELRALLDSEVKACLQAQGIQLIHFGDLKDDG
jgi:predicted glycoside hydrolase/deacetylase ChbG (UPF0249 family)